MVEYLTSLRVMANEIDTEVREESEEDECNELYHASIVNENSEIFEISELKKNL